VTHFKGIFFDAGNTLLRVHPSIGVIYSEAARMFGAEVEPASIEQSFKELWNRTAPLVANEGHRLSYEKERDWWKYLVREVFKDLVAFEDFDRFFDYLYFRFEHSDSWRLYDDVMEVLEYLSGTELTLAIISNWDSRLPSLCKELGLAPFFQTMVISAVVGYEKPHPAIFQIALERTKLRPQDVLYIGDDPYLDYQAAQKAGMYALHLDRAGRFPDHPDKISSLHQLLERIGHR
jgi:putative hydrolase of the HAD superfamily